MMGLCEDREDVEKWEAHVGRAVAVVEGKRMEWERKRVEYKEGGYEEKVRNMMEAFVSILKAAEKGLQEVLEAILEQLMELKRVREVYGVS
ncbi:hypothetical protein HDV00_008673 [Rhizophlyctis rosea]|nr:hypothetical protein HDV00_008673 [Rhizophlyctis rosea]